MKKKLKEKKFSINIANTYLIDKIIIKIKFSIITQWFSSKISS